MNAGEAEKYTLQIQRGCQYLLRREARKCFQSERDWSQRHQAG